MSPVDSLMPPFSLPLPAPPGVVWNTAWPSSWPTTSIGVAWRVFAWLWPKLTYEPFQYAFTSASPTRIGGVLPLPRMPLRLNHDENMSTSRWAPHRASTQAVSRLVPEPVPHASSVPVYAVPPCPPHLSPGRVVSVMEYDEPEPEVLMVTLP